MNNTNTTKDLAPAELVAAHTTETPSARRFLLCAEKGDAK